MSRVRTRALMAIAAILLGLTAWVGVPAQPALAAPCWSLSCNNLDPQSTGCGSQATTLEQFSWSGVYIELRYSSLCNAAWARAYWNGPCNNNVAGWAWIHAYADSQGTQWKSSDSENLPCNNITTSWTTMRSFTYWVKACYDVYPVYWCTRLR